MIIPRSRLQRETKGEEEKSEEVLVARSRSAGEKNTAMFLLAEREFSRSETIQISLDVNQ